MSVSLVESAATSALQDVNNATDPGTAQQAQTDRLTPVSFNEKKGGEAGPAAAGTPGLPTAESVRVSGDREPRPSGPPIPLGQIPNVNFLITNKFSGKDPSLKTIHTLLFWRPGTHLKVKQSLRQWAGVPADEPPAVATARRQRMQQRLGRLKMDELKQVCTALDLPLSGTKEELVQRVVCFLEHPFIWPGRRDLVALAERRRKRRSSKAKQSAGSKRKKIERSRSSKHESRTGSNQWALSPTSTLSSAAENEEATSSDDSSSSEFVPPSLASKRGSERARAHSPTMPHGAAAAPHSESPGRESSSSTLRPEVVHALQALLQHASDRLNTLTMKQLRLEVSERITTPIADEEMGAFRQLVRSILLSTTQTTTS